MKATPDTPWRLLPARRSVPEAVLSDLLEHRVRWIEHGRCSRCDTPLDTGGAWCWTGINATSGFELRHLAEPDVGVLYPSELAILLPWLDEQRALKGVRDFRQGSLSASAIGFKPESHLAQPPRRRKWPIVVAGLVGFVLGIGATVLALLSILNGPPFG